MRISRPPEGWSEERVRRVLEHYDKQSENEAVAEDEGAYEDGAPAVRERIARHRNRG